MARIAALCASTILRAKSGRRRSISSLPALLIKLKPWVVELDAELPRAGHGYRADVDERELYDSARAWWRRQISIGWRAVVTQSRSTKASLARRGEIDHATWRTSSSRPGKRAFEGRVLSLGEDAWADFVGPLGRASQTSDQVAYGGSLETRRQLRIGPDVRAIASCQGLEDRALCRLY